MNKTSNMYTDIVRGYKLKIHPTESQRMRIDQLLSLSINAYNWSLETIESIYKETGHMTRDFKMNTLISKMYNSSYAPKWTKDLPVSIAREQASYAIRNYILFMNKVNRGRPRFKNKRHYNRSFHISNTKFFVNPYGKENLISITGLGHGKKAWIKCDTKYLPKGENITYYICTLSRDISGYWISVNIGYKKPFTLDEPFENTGETIGIDLGVRKRATLSDGTVFKGPNTEPLNKRLRRKSIRYGKDRRRRLDISQRTQVKYEEVPKTQNEIKRETEYRKLERRKHNINYSYNHMMTAAIINKNPKMIVMEDLDVRGLIKDSKNKFVIGKIRESDFYGIKKMILYKAKLRDIPVRFADRFYPSSQICSFCGSKFKQGSSEVYYCPLCDREIDRDLNAAINLSRLKFEF